MIDIATSKPIDRKTAMVVGDGVNHTVLHKIKQKVYSIIPPMIPFRKIDFNEDLTGFKLGRLTVLGLADSDKLDLSRKSGIPSGRWVVRCQCGNYELFRRSTINRGNIKMCSECEYKRKMKDRLYFKQHGFWPDEVGETK